LQAIEAVRLENRDLRGLLEFAEDQPVRLVAARVVGRNFDTRPTMILVDVGEMGGVVEKLPVVTAEGVFGKTVAVNPRSSRVMLYSHPDFSASALLLGGDHLEFGVVRSDRNGSLELYLSLRSASAPGNRIVTSGYGGTFPRGIPIGDIVEVREDRRLGLQRIDRLRPVVDLESVTAAFVLVRDTGTGGSAGDVVRLFWPGYAYPPMAGETLGRPDTIPVRDDEVR
jgi:rod shape-determining protein MreC